MLLSDYPYVCCLMVVGLAAFKTNYRKSYVNLCMVTRLSDLK